MSDVLLFAGTIEGKELAEALCKSRLTVHAFTATEYGGALLSEQIGQKPDTNLQVTSERLKGEQMLAFMQAEAPRLVIDATHPYAVEVSDNIRRAAEAAGIDLIRVRRKESMSASGTAQLGAKAATAAEQAEVVHVSSPEEAVAFLEKTNGNVLLTCGSKELPAFTKLDNYEDRLYARVLSTENVVRECAALGFSGKHLIAMQGPFSLEMNQALIRHIGAEWLVTKESGIQGGFPEKAEAAAMEGIGLVVIDRPADDTAEQKRPADETTEQKRSEEDRSCQADNSYRVCDSVESCLKETYRIFGIRPEMKFILLGIGPGNAGGLTMEGRQALEEADVVLGATRMLGILNELNLAGKPVFRSWKPAEMKQFVDENPQYQNVAVALSGDPGFYSGAAKLLEVWRDEDIRVLPGLSTLQVLCARAKTDWQHVYCISRHGRAGNLLSALRTQEAVFLLPGETLPELCEKLIGGGFSDVTIVAGSRLSYEDEKILTGTPEELKANTCEEPYAVLIKNPKAKEAVVTPGIPDKAFLRVKAERQVSAEQQVSTEQLIPTDTKKPKQRTIPMTKEEVRTVSLAKLRLTKNAVVYDIGAGTGSVSVEAARIAYAGCVFAIEQNPSAVALLRENKDRFGLDNLEIIEGMAPEAMEELPVPTHVFIGGSKGNLAAIVEMLRQKNPAVRIVINTVTVETETEARKVLEELEKTQEDIQSEVIRLSVTREERVGGYHMQRAENPITIISFGGSYD